MYENAKKSEKTESPTTLIRIDLVQEILEFRKEKHLSLGIMYLFSLLNIKECVEIGRQIPWKGILTYCLVCRMEDIDGGKDTDGWWELYNNVSWHLELYPIILERVKKIRLKKQ